MHKNVSKIQMDGINSEAMNSIEFVPTAGGIQQVYKGNQKNLADGKSDSKLPVIRMDRQAVR